jgi:hypothetical protein
MQAPMTLQARDYFQQGIMWTLSEWLLACRGRSATDVRDLVFAGLSLVNTKGLVIDPNILLEDSETTTTGSGSILARHMYDPQTIPPLGLKANDRSFSNRKPTSSINLSPLIPNGLWPALVADYTVNKAEVFINTAACLLTQSGTQELLSIAARTNRPSAYDSDWWISTSEHTSLEDLPSWVPVPGPWTVCSA